MLASWPVWRQTRALARRPGTPLPPSPSDQVGTCVLTVVLLPPSDDPAAGPAVEGAVPGGQAHRRDLVGEVDRSR